MYYKNLFASLMGLLLATACGGDFEDFDEEQLASAEQGLSAPIGSQGFGDSGGNNHPRCTGASGQECFVPKVPNKQITTCFSQNIPSAQRTQLRAGLASIEADSNWTFPDVGGFCDVGQNLLNSELSFLGTSGSSLGAGPTSNALSAFARFDLTGTVGTLTESLPGVWKYFTKIVVAVDHGDIATRGTFVATHVGAHGAGLFIGLGSIADNTNSFMNRGVDKITGVPGLSQVESCQAGFYDLSSPTSFSFVGSCSP